MKTVLYTQRISFSIQDNGRGHVRLTTSWRIGQATRYCLQMKWFFLKKGAQLSSFIRKEILGEKNSSIKTVENSVPSQIISNIFDLISPPQSLMIMINSPEKIHENDFDLLHTK